MTDIEIPMIVSVEWETVIRDCPPYLCASRCPAYNRDPCGPCDMRPVLWTDRIIITGDE